MPVGYCALRASDNDLVARAVRDSDVGCNKRSALHRMFGCYKYGAMPIGYCALRGLLTWITVSTRAFLF
jgi:hypothetical protein